mgnify:CR=1 FL=1
MVETTDGFEIAEADLEHRGSENIAEVFEEAVVESALDASEKSFPTTGTTSEDMERARPDLLTGELKLPKLE